MEEAKRAVGAPTIAEAFRLTVEDHPDRIAVRGEDLELTWAQLRDRSDAFAGTLGKERIQQIEHLPTCRDQLCAEPRHLLRPRRNRGHVTTLQRSVPLRDRRRVIGRHRAATRKETPC